MSNVTNKPLQVDTMTTKPTVLQVSFRTTTIPSTGVYYDYYTFYRYLLYYDYYNYYRCPL